MMMWLPMAMDKMAMDDVIRKDRKYIARKINRCGVGSDSAAEPSDDARDKYRLPITPSIHNCFSLLTGLGRCDTGSNTAR